MIKRPPTMPKEAEGASEEDFERTKTGMMVDLAQKRDRDRGNLLQIRMFCVSNLLEAYGSNITGNDISSIIDEAKVLEDYIVRA